MECAIKIENSPQTKTENIKEVSDFVMAVLASTAADAVKMKALDTFTEMAAASISHCHFDASTHHHYPEKEQEASWSCEDPADYDVTAGYEGEE